MTKNMTRRKNVLIILLALSLTTATAQHVIHYLNIDVCLNDDGSARVTEKRTCTIGSQGTEGFITMKNMGDIGVEALSVRDEEGTVFIHDDGNWDTERSRQQKTGRCGVHRISGGVELCWGIGHSGMRTYEISYTLTNLVKAYGDYDGFNHSFYEASDPPAQSVTLNIFKADGRLHRPSSRIWAFGFYGTVLLNDSLLMVSSTQPFKTQESMIVMCQFDKGIFHPVCEGAGTFADVRKAAFVGSDYSEELYQEQDLGQDQEDSPMRLSSSLAGGEGFSGHNVASLTESAKETIKDFSSSENIILVVVIIAFIYFLIKGVGSGGGSSSGRSSSGSSRSSGWGGSSSRGGGGGHSGGGGSGFR